MATQNIKTNSTNVEKNFERLPKLTGEVQSEEAYLKLIAEYYELTTSKNAFFSKNNITQHKFNRIENFMKQYYPKQIEAEVKKRRRFLEEKTKYHDQNLSVVMEQILKNEFDITRILSGEFDIEFLIALVSKNSVYKKHLKKLHMVRGDLKKYKGDFDLQSYLSMNIEIAGVKVTKEIVDETLKHMNENGKYICNYTVQESIREKLSEKQK